MIPLILSRGTGGGRTKSALLALKKNTIVAMYRRAGGVTVSVKRASSKKGKKKASRKKKSTKKGKKTSSRKKKSTKKGKRPTAKKARPFKRAGGLFDYSESEGDEFDDYYDGYFDGAYDDDGWY